VAALDKIAGKPAHLRDRSAALAEAIELQTETSTYEEILEHMVKAEIFRTGQPALRDSESQTELQRSDEQSAQERIKRILEWRVP